ncbi:MAG: hypothetical protein ABMA14_27300 [Hyphomonadaceae bacterium]
MSLHLKIMIAVLALGLSTFAVFGDDVFRAMGLPSGSGRIVVAAILLVIGVIWFVASSKWAQRIARNVASHRRD